MRHRPARACRRPARRPPCAGGLTSATSALADYGTDRDRRRPRRDVAAVAVPQDRRGAPAHPPRRPRGRAPHRGDGRRAVRDRAGLARVLRRRAVAPPALGVARPAARAVRACPTTSRRGRDRGVAQGRTGYPIVDAGDAPAARTRAGCTTGCGWSPRASSPRTCTSGGRSAPGTSSTTSSTATSPRNNHGWQWVAGTGTDASPYFRVFNPVTQGLRFDPDGDYVRRWVPELAHLPGTAAHEPWKHDDGYAHGYPERDRRPRRGAPRGPAALRAARG